MVHHKTRHSRGAKPSAPAKQKRRLVSQAAVMLALALIISVYFTVMASAQCTYTITDGENVTVHTSTATDIAEVLAEAGIEVDEDDLITSSSQGASTQILIQRSQYVTVSYQGSQLATATYDATVQDLLGELNIALGSDDVITAYGEPLSVNDTVYDGMSIVITSTTSKTVTETVAVPYETVTYLDPTLAVGTSTVKTAGVDGQQEITYQQDYVDGELTGTAIIGRKLLSAPVNEVILLGSGAAAPTEEEAAVAVYTEPEETETPVQESETKTSDSDAESGKTESDESSPTGTDYQEPEYEEPEYQEPAYDEPVYEEPVYDEPEYEEPDYEEPSSSGNTITTASGQVLTYSSVLSVEATAYTGGGTTATGTPARYGAIAVDPKVIPYGTRMYIVSDDGKWIYGEATAEDCGGAIKGNIIDLYFDDYNTCIQFGRRNCTVYILD